MIGICGEPQCLCKQYVTPASVELGMLRGSADRDLSRLSDHELRWALRESIDVMYKHLGLEEEEGE